MTKREAVRQHQQETTLVQLGFTFEEAAQLRRISMTLHQWAEHECNGAIQRDGENGDGAPYWYSTMTGKRLGRCADREAGAKRRLAAIVARVNLHVRHGVMPDGSGVEKTGALGFYIQGDPRGAALYILRPGDVPEGKDADGYYSRGICVY